MGRNLNNFEVSPQSWYPVLRSSQIRRGRARAVDALNRRIAVYRDGDGAVHALDARCSHMGADLSLGAVCGKRLQCPLHKWEYDPQGAVRAAPFEYQVPARRVRSYPARERYGYVWIFNGPTPLFDLFDVDRRDYVTFTLPPQTFRNHPHFLTANGLDWRHLNTLHDMELSRNSICRRKEPFGVVVDHLMRPGPAWLKVATGSRNRFIQASFETLGCNLALITVGERPDFFLMFANTPLNNRTTRTWPVIFLSRQSPVRFVSSMWLYLIMTFFVLLRQDHKIFQSTEFFPGFTDVDDAFRLFAQVADEQPTY